MLETVLDLAEKLNITLSDEQKEAFEDFDSVVDLYFDLADPSDFYDVDPIYEMDDFDEVMQDIFDQYTPTAIAQMLNFNENGNEYNFDWSKEFFSVDDLQHVFSYSYKEVYDMLSDERTFENLIDQYSEENNLETADE